MKIKKKRSDWRLYRVYGRIYRYQCLKKSEIIAKRDMVAEWQLEWETYDKKIKNDILASTDVFCLEDGTLCVGQDLPAKTFVNFLKEEAKNLSLRRRMWNKNA